jgi:hypothetical protein
MSRNAFLTAAAILLSTTGLRADTPAKIQAQGAYLEARTCDVWTGPCFANADFNLSGKNGVMAWKIDKGQAQEVSLDGLSVVAVIAAHNTLGLDQRAPAKVVLIVDERANEQQRAALIAFAQQQGGDLLETITAVQKAPIALNVCDCKGKSCASLDAGVARIKTRCLDADHDKVCGNESAFYPPLARGVQAVPAAAEEHAFRGTGLGHTWSDNERRGAYVGTFEVR